MDADLEAILPTFLGESEESLGVLEQQVLLLDTAKTEDEVDRVVAELFRAAHTLKGNAESLGFEAIGRCAHALEGVLDALRRRTLVVSPSVVTILLNGHDALRSMLATAATGAAPDAAAHEEALHAMMEVASGHASSRPSGPEAGAAPEGPFVGAQVKRSLRVDLATLDQAVTHTGELSIALSRLGGMLDRRGDAVDALHDVDRLFNDLRELVMRIRLVPIGPMLRQQLRPIRDMAAGLGKLARLAVEGDEVEVDAAVRDGLRDAVTHMVRNALDHALETPEVRKAAGKEPYGTVTLRARREAGWVVVEVCDDGSGFRRATILQRARTLGLVKDGATPSDEEILRFVLAPGFSTARTVTDLSGRGVGMDVVARNVAALKGFVSIRSVEGQGSVVTLRVPLTLSIIEGFAVEACRETYVIPMESVRECVGIRSARADDSRRREGVVNLRGEPLPYVQLSSVLGMPTSEITGDTVVVIEHEGIRAGFVVDALHGETRAVVRPLGEGLGHADRVAGATILGDGRVALILDVPAILRAAVAGGAS